MDADKRDRLARGEEVDALLENTVFCPRAVAAPNGVQCRLWGAEARRWIDPTGGVCRICRFSPEYGGGRDINERYARDLGRRCPADVPGAKGRMLRRINRLGIDRQLAEARDYLAEAITWIPGMSDDDAVRLARELGVVDDRPGARHG